MRHLIIALLVVAGGCRLDATFKGHDMAQRASAVDDMAKVATADLAACPAGYHLCAGACVNDQDPGSCNQSCTPCNAPTGGTATCDGVMCGGSCPTGTKLCLGACISSSTPCSGTCATGTHNCGGICVDDESPNSCGSSCTPCPVPANAYAAVCSGGACGFMCGSGYKACGSNCIPSSGCCSTNDCTQPSNGSAVCNTSTNSCVITCNNGYSVSGSTCAPWTCSGQGNTCTTGQGACQRSGSIVCTAQGVASCNAVAGAPDTTGTWHQAAAPNGSWDWDCDGAVEYQYPSGDTTPPIKDTDPSYTNCTGLAPESVCTAPHWFYSYWSHWVVSCGHEVDDNVCYWSNGCQLYAPQPATQGCR